VGVHPGYAKGKLVNAIRMLADFVNKLPREMSPECTEEREGYIHPYVLEGQAEQLTVKMLLRDFEMSGIEEQKKMVNAAAEEIQAEYPKGRVEVEFIEYYRNMRYKVEEEPRLVEYAQEAIRRIDVEPNSQLIRGGTDGSRLSYMGLPCPNMFAGGEAIHSEREWVAVQVMDKASEVIIRLSELWAEKSV
jgi:tripeptide aminopeptidase